MASTYTDGLGIELIGTGDRAGSWGDVTNNNLQSLEQSIRGVSTVALTGTTSTLNIGDGSTASETATDAAGRSSVIIFTGTLGATHTVTLQVGGTNADRASFVAMNETTQDVALSRGSGNAVTIPSGYTARIFLDGTDARNALSNLKLDKIRFKNDEITNATAGTFRITGDIANLGESSGTDDVYLTTPSSTKDLILQTNGTTSGRSKIVIDSADNGNIDVTPHGTGSVVISKADINSGTIDGTTINATSVTTSSATITGGTINNTIIGGATPAAGNFSTVDINGGTIDGTIVGGTTPAAGNFSTVDIDGGTIDGATLNASTITNSPISGGSGSFTTLSATGTTTTAAINASGNIDSGGNVTASNFTADANGNISTSGTGAISTVNGDISTSGTGSISSNRTITAATGITATTGGLTATAGGLTVTAGGADISGGIDNNSGGITNTGNISGAGTIGSGAITSSGAITGTSLTASSSGAIAGGAITGTSLSVGTGASNTVTAGKVTTGEINHATSITSKIGAGDKFKVDTNGAQVVATNGYLNMSSTSGATGFGLRNNSGTLEIKNSSLGSWGSIAILSGSDLSVSGSVTAGTTVTAGTGLTVTSGGASISGNSTVTGTLSGLTGLTVASGGANITGNSLVTGTLRSTSTLTASAGLNVTTGGITVSLGGINNSNGGISNAGAVAGVTTLAASGEATFSGTRVDIKDSLTFGPSATQASIYTNSSASAGLGVEQLRFYNGSGVALPGTTGKYFNITQQSGSTGVGFRSSSFTVEVRSKNTATADTWGRIYHSGMVSGDGAFFEYSTSGTTIVNDATFQFTTGFNSIPSFTQVYLVCTASDLNWAVGDYLDVSATRDGSAGGNRSGVTLSFDGSASNDGFLKTGEPPDILNKTAASHGQITWSSWDIVVKCWK